jgi:predicted ATPase/class 3 adenylate cyclase
MMGVMPELPTGTVTLLFTDIEGSTRLLERLGDQYLEALAEHRRLLRAAFAQYSGREVSTEGDAFFVAFATTGDAVSAAVAGQRALAAHRWSDGVVLRVRMGIHTGEPILVADDYAGLDVHRAARICAAGHGGQVLLSQATRDLLGAELPLGSGLRDLGDHRLKDLTRPERLFQLAIPGLPAEFPTLRALGPGNVILPLQLTSFVGRQREVAAIRGLLERPEVRLLTLSGPGGTGKTRLAVQVAGELLGSFPGGVFFVALAPVNDPGLVVPTVAQALGVRAIAGQSLLESLIEHMGDRRLLLVLDNVEQVLNAAPAVVDLLAACPRLRALVTSRAALHVSGEQVYPVPPLSLPDQKSANAVRDLASSEAMTLLVERAQAVNPSFAVTDANTAVLAEICRRLDGLPLAIELAAARTKLLSPQALLSRLERRLQLLQGGLRDRPARQQTLRATLDWSYDLLEAGEQMLFARLAVFVSGCTLKAAEAICNLEGDLDVLTSLDALVDQNLLQPRDGIDDDLRVVLLETVREYALERLSELSEADAIGRRHAQYYLELAELAESELKGPRQEAWYQQLEADLDNFRATLAWFLTHQDAEVTARLAWALTDLWESHGHLSEGLRWLDAALDQRDNLSRPALAKALFGKAYLLLNASDHHGQADTLLEESLRLFQELGDTTLTISALSMLGWAAEQAGEVDRGLDLRERAVALARGQNDRLNLATALSNLGLSLLMTDDHARARAPLEESLALCRALGDLKGIASAIDALAMLELDGGDRTRASSMMEEALALARRIGHVRDAAIYLADLGIVGLHEGEHGRAATLFQEALRLARQADNKLLIAVCLWGMAIVAVAQGQPVRAVRLWGAAANLGYTSITPSFAFRPLEDRFLPSVRDTLGENEFRAQWAKGQAMRRDGSIAYALEHH